MLFRYSQTGPHSLSILPKCSLKGKMIINLNLPQCLVSPATFTLCFVICFILLILFVYTSVSLTRLQLHQVLGLKARWNPERPFRVGTDHGSNVCSGICHSSYSFASFHSLWGAFVRPRVMFFSPYLNS